MSFDNYNKLLIFVDEVGWEFIGHFFFSLELRGFRKCDVISGKWTSLLPHFCGALWGYYVSEHSSAQEGSLNFVIETSLKMANSPISALTTELIEAHSPPSVRVRVRVFERTLQKEELLIKPLIKALRLNSPQCFNSKLERTTVWKPALFKTSTMKKPEQSSAAVHCAHYTVKLPRGENYPLTAGVMANISLEYVKDHKLTH